MTNTKTEVSEREQIRQRFTRRASNPPLDEAAQADYTDEMRALEEQLRGAGEVI